MTTVGNAFYLEVGVGGYPDGDLARPQRKRGGRTTKRSLRWKAPWVRPRAVVFASDVRGGPTGRAAFFGAWQPRRADPPGFRKKLSEGLVSGQSLRASLFQGASDISGRQKVSGSIGLG